MARSDDRCRDDGEGRDDAPNGICRRANAIAPAISPCETLEHRRPRLDPAHWAKMMANYRPGREPRGGNSYDFDGLWLPGHFRAGPCSAAHVSGLSARSC